MRSTLHTNDAVGAITRLGDMGIASYKVAAAVVGVVAQRLVRTICEDCRVPYFAPGELLKSMNYQGDTRRQFARGEGCEKCFDTGYKGRTGIYEALMVTPKIRAQIAANATLDELRETHRNEGGSSLMEEGLKIAESELTSLDEVLRIANTGLSMES